MNTSLDRGWLSGRSLFPFWDRFQKRRVHFGSMRNGTAKASTLLSLLATVSVAIGLALSGLYLVRRLVPAALLRESNDVVGNYLQTLGTVYAVLLAFVVFVVWSQFNEARSHVER